MIIDNKKLIIDIAMFYDSIQLTMNSIIYIFVELIFYMLFISSGEQNYVRIYSVIQ